MTFDDTIGVMNNGTTNQNIMPNGKLFFIFYLELLNQN